MTARLRLRDAQIAALAADHEARSAASFRQRLLAAAPQVAAMRQADLAQACADARDSAAAIGLHDDKDVQRYTILLATLGFPAADDPQFGALQAMLADPALPDPSRRLDRVWKRAVALADTLAHNAENLQRWQQR